MNEDEFEVWCRREFNDPKFTLVQNKIKENEHSITANYNNNR